MVKNDLQKEILETLAYYQVFNYFLSADELHKFLHSSSIFSKKEIFKKLNQSWKIVNKKIIFLDEQNQKTKKRKKNRQKNMKIQEKKLTSSFKKIEIAKKTARFLKIIPSIKLIAISGNLAMMNAESDDDIDFFLIASRGTAWTTRLFVNLILIMFGQKRMFKEKNVKNKICLNFIVDEDNLRLRKQNVYTAHEIAQMKILFDKENTHKVFIKNNSWVKNFLANFWESCRIPEQTSLFEDEKSSKFNPIIFFFRAIEPLSHFIQFQYMRKKITCEKIGKGIMMFHPRDYSSEIMKKYKANLKFKIRN